MQMQRAFHAKMLTKLIKYSVAEGVYDENNQWIQGRLKKSNIWGVIKTGNQFSQFDEGEALHAGDGGARFSNFRTLYVTDKYPLEKSDKIKFKGKYFNILQRSDESVYGFYKVLLEESEYWKP